MSNPLISIIIPTYNSENTLQSCLESITKQSFISWEVILVDGQSDDNTLNIIRELANKFSSITYISEKDEGIYDAMNKGIQLAKGEWMYFLGSDDTLYNDRVLSEINENIIKTSAKAVYGNVIMRGSNKWVQDGYVHAGEFDLQKLLYQNICHQAIFYHKSLFSTIGIYNLKYPVFADYDFNLRSFAKYQFNYIDVAIANFNVGGHSTQINDPEFEKEKGPNIIKYFYENLHRNAFINSRLYVKRAAFGADSSVKLITRFTFLITYLFLKAKSILVSKPFN